MTKALALGFLVGLPIAATPGPIFFLVLRRTLARSWLNGFVSGLGVATGDAIYAALAAFGITAITSVLISERRWIGLLGGIAIVVVGARIVLQGPHPDLPPKGEGKEDGEGSERSQHAGAYLSILALTLSNPPTILSFAAVFAGLGLHVATGWLPAVLLVIGVFLGSAAWWLILTGLVSCLRARVTPRMTQGIGDVAGVLLVAFGLFTVGSAFLS